MGEQINPKSIKLLSVAEIVQTRELPHEDVPVPEWGEGVGVRVRALDAETMDNLQAQAKKGGVPEWALLLAASIVDAEGKPTMTAEQAVTLKKQSARAIARIVGAANRLNGLGQEALEEIKRDFPHAQTGSSNSV